jgi:hypothetical protein
MIVAQPMHQEAAFGRPAVHSGARMSHASLFLGEKGRYNEQGEPEEATQ